MSQFRGTARRVKRAALSSKVPMVVQDPGVVSPVVHIRGTKYWRKTMTPDYSRMFERWSSDMSLAPTDGTWIMGRISGTNRSRAFKWDTDRWIDQNSDEHNLCQWIDFKDFGMIRTCVWRGNAK